MTVAPEAVLDPFGLVAKHGSHDQKDHGNWARGGKQDYPTGYVVPGDPASGDYRVESEPARRFTEFWQRTYEGYGLVREAAMRVLDGKDPLGNTLADHHSVLFQMDNGTWVNGQYTEQDLHTDIASAGRWVADGLRNGETGKVLFRGTNLTQAQIDRLATSDETLELGPSATSSHLGVAQGYSAANVEWNERRVVFRFPETTKHLDLAKHGDWGKDHPEQIVAGKFKVTGVFENRLAPGSVYVSEHERAEPQYYVNLEPVEQP